jgi:hypothetical protein
MVSTALTFLNYVHRRAMGEADDKEWIRAINFLRDLIFVMDDVAWPDFRPHSFTHGNRQTCATN